MVTADANAGSTAVAAYRELVDEFVSGAGATDSKMFGSPTLRIGGKVFAILWEEEMVFKLPVGERERALAIAGAHLFDPGKMGRAMKEWIVVPVVHAHEWSAFGWAALHYVSIIAAEGAPKTKRRTVARSRENVHRPDAMA